MKAAKVTIGVDTPAIKKVIGEVVARAVNEAAKSLREIREWCDQTEANALNWQVDTPADEAYAAALGKSVREIRALLPALPEVAGEVTEVAGTRVTRDDREL